MFYAEVLYGYGFFLFDWIYFLSLSTSSIGNYAHLEIFKVFIFGCKLYFNVRYSSNFYYFIESQHKLGKILRMIDQVIKIILIIFLFYSFKH